jgi:hypothetical protein
LTSLTTADLAHFAGFGAKRLKCRKKSSGSF